MGRACSDTKGSEVLTDPWFFVLLVAGPLVFWRLPTAWRMSALSALSIGYLGSKAPGSTLAIVAWTLAFVALAPRITDARKPLQFAAGMILAILGFLVAFKYAPPIVDAITGSELEAAIFLPLGLSYYAFKLIHYVVESKRGNLPEHRLSDVLAWTTLFPAFTAGPIERFDHFLKEREETPSKAMYVEGWTRIVHGIVKKLIFADGIALGAAQMFGSASHPEAMSTPATWAFTFFMYLWAYLDFSAYSDLAIGGGRLFGIRLMENFNWPILANSISNFWKRWHMTLAGWCQVHVYMPFVGISRNPYAATYLTFLTMGLWHGAALNWVFWGLFHGTGVAVHLTWSRYKRKRKWHKWMDKGWWKYAGILPTTLFVTAAASFTTTAHVGWREGLVMFLKLFFIDASGLLA